MRQSHWRAAAAAAAAAAASFVKHNTTHGEEVPKVTFLPTLLESPQTLVLHFLDP